MGLGVSSDGAVGNSTKEVVLKPVKIMDDVLVSPVMPIILAIKKDGTLWGWGSNRYGALGKAGKTVLKPVKLMDDVKMASAGRHATVVVKRQYPLAGWQIGRGTVKWEIKAGFRQAMANVNSQRQAEDVIFAIKEDGTLWGWGFNEKAQIGNGTRTGDNSLSAGGKLDDSGQMLDDVSYIGLHQNDYHGDTMAVSGCGAVRNRAIFIPLMGLSKAARLNR